MSFTLFKSVFTKQNKHKKRKHMKKTTTVSYLDVLNHFQEYVCFMFLTEAQTRNVTGTASGQNVHCAMLHSGRWHLKLGI